MIAESVAAAAISFMTLVSTLRLWGLVS